MPGTEGHSRKIRFGAYELDEAARQLRKHGLSVRLQDQPWEVLLALLERPGEVVSREDLQRRLWPDGTFVDYEQSLNKAVNKLRDALLDSADKPRYVETVARRGYRFVAAVEKEEPKEAPAPVIQAARPQRRTAWGAGVLGIVAGLLVTGLWPVSAPKVRLTQLTHGGRVSSPCPAVHDGRILYTSGSEAPSQFATEFWSISTDGGEPRRERMPFLRPDYAAWLIPINNRRGFILIGAQAPSPIDTGVELWLAGFDGSKARKIGEGAVGSGYSVSPDLRTLLRAGKEGLFARPVDGDSERLIARVNWKETSLTVWHPSGERVGFWPLNDGPLKIWEVKTDGTGMRPLLPEYQAEQRGASWSADGQRLYFVSQGEVFVQGSRRWLGWMRRQEPQRLTTGSVRYSIPFEDSTDPRVIFSTGQVLHGEAMKLNKQAGLFEPYLDPLSADCLDYSPNGQWIAYVSFPARELWKCRRDGSDKLPLEDGLLTYMPRWSPDGKRLAFAATGKGAWGDPHRIYTIAAQGGRAEPVKGVNGPSFTPNWSPDGKKLVFAPFDYELVPKQDRHVSIVDLDTSEVQMVPGSEDMYSPHWSPDGKHLVALRWEQNEPVIYDFETRRWANVGVNFLGFPAWSKDNNYVYGAMGNPTRLVRIEVATRKVEEIRSIREFRLVGNLFPGVSWTPDGEPVVLADMSTTEIYRIDVER